MPINFPDDSPLINDTFTDTNGRTWKFDGVSWNALPQPTVPISASEGAKGVIQLASQAEVDAGTDTEKAVTPNTLSNFSGLGGGSGDVTDGGTLTTGLTFPSDGLKIQDAGSPDHVLTLSHEGSADSTLTLDTGDTNRTLTLTGDATVSGTNTGDQIASDVSFLNSPSNLTATDVQAAIDELDSNIDNLNVSNLADVTITDIGANEILQWSGSEWVNLTIPEAGIAPAAHSHTTGDITDFNTAVDGRIGLAVLDDLADVTETTITTGDLLRWDGSVWVNYADTNYTNFTPKIQNTTPETGTFTASLGETHLVDLSATSFVANLPLASSGNGKIAFYITTTNHLLTLTPTGGNTINGKSSIKIDHGHNTIENDGTGDWKLVQRSGINPFRLDSAEITADQDGYSPNGGDWTHAVTHLYISSDTTRTINGFDENGFTDMAQVIVTNDGLNDIVIKHDTSTLDANKVLVDNNADYILSPNQVGILMRDGTANRWRFYGLNNATAGSGDIATDTIWNVRGDLAVATADNTAIRLPVGTDTYVLTADSADATFGLKWAPAPGASASTLSAISTQSIDIPKSLYTMTSTIPVEFETSANSTLLYLDEATARVGIGTNAPSTDLHVLGGFRLETGAVDSYVLTSNADGLASWQPAQGNVSDGDVLPTGLEFPWDGLKIQDQGSPIHSLTLSYEGSADSILTVDTGDTNRLLTLTGDATVSGTNTGDQTISLTGDVTATGGTGALSTQISAGVVGTTELTDAGVTFPKIQNINQNSILGRTSTGAGDVEELTDVQVRTIINVDEAGTDNSQPVSLANIPSPPVSFLTLDAGNQILTVDEVNLATDVQGVLPAANIGSHTHTSGDITNFDSAVDARITSGAVSSAGAVMEADTTTALMSFVDNNAALGDWSGAVDTQLATQTAIKSYVDTEINNTLASSMEFKGGYDATTDPNSTASIGDVYVVTVSGTGVANFWSAALETGDIIIAQQNNPTLESHWAAVERNLNGAALKTDKLDVFASTTSAELASVISDVTGTGDLVFGTNPTIATPTLTLKQGTTPTVEGVIEWDAGNDAIKIGDGTSTQTFSSDANLSITASQVSDFDSGVAAALPVVDETALVHKTGDAAASVSINADALSAATPRTITMPDADVDLGDVHLPVTLVSNAPSPDLNYITLTGQELDLGFIDITTDITGSWDATAVNTHIGAGTLTYAKMDTGIKASLDKADAALQSSAIGVTIQAYDAELAEIAALSPSDNDILKYSGGAWTLAQETGGHDPVTLVSNAPSPDLNYITLTGQELDLGFIDITTDITGSWSLTDVNTHINTGSIALDKIVDINSKSFIGRFDPSVGPAQNLTGAQAASIIFTPPGGTEPTLEIGDSFVGGNALTSGDLLQYDSANTRWRNIPSSTFADGAHTHDAIAIVSGEFPTARFADDSVTYAKIQNAVADNIILGNNAGAGGIIKELTSTEVKTILNIAENATHTGDATGDTALTLQPAAITGKAELTTTIAVDDKILLSDSDDTGNLKSATLDNIHKAISPVTTKGDIYIHDVNGITRLPVVGDGLYLKSNPAVDAGMAWGAAPVGSGDLLSAQNLADVADPDASLANINGAPKYVSGTGVLTGGVLSIGTPNTTYSISDGTGIVTDQNGAVTNVSWTGKTNITPAALIASPTTELLTWVAIDSGGNVFEKTSPFTSTEARQYIVLGVIVHTDFTTVQTVNNEQLPYKQPVNQLYDLAEAIGFINVSGNVFGPSVQDPTTLKISKTAGEIFKFGSNYDIDATNPHVKTLAGADTHLGPGFPDQFQYRFSDGTSGPLTDTLIDPDNLDDGAGGFTAVGNNQWSVQRIYQFVSNNIKLQRGRESFATKAAAIEGIAGEAYVTEPSIAANGLLRGWLVVQRGATDLSDITQAQFIVAPKFGEGTTGGTSAPAGDATSVLLSSKKGTAGTISVGQVVRATGWDAGSNTVLVELADSDAIGEMPAFGIARTPITDTDAGTIVFSGILTGVDTSTFDVGDSLYVGTTAGQLVNTRPTTLGSKVQTVARVLSQGTNGVIQVVGSGRINDIPNFTAADRYWYGDATGASVEGTITQQGRDLLDDADAATQRATLGLGALATTNTSKNWYVLKMGDESTAPEVGVKSTWIIPAAGKIHGVHFGCTVAPTGGGITLDVKKNGSTILSQTGIIAINTRTVNHINGQIPTLITDPTTLGSDDEITVEITDFGGTDGGGLHCNLLMSWDAQS